MGINIERDRLELMARYLGCSIGSIPFLFLGIKVGLFKNSRAEWFGLIDKVKSKLRSWEDKKISFGGRITLLKSVLSAIPIYQLSFYRLPKKTLRDLTSLQRRFLWGGCESNQKIAWLKWNEICKSKSAEGLGVRDLESFNLTLLGKWWWRYLCEGEKLWVRVIDSLYGRVRWGEEGAKVEGSASRWSGWWRGIMSIGSGRGSKWLWENLVRKLGDGRTIQFWKDLWVGDRILKDKFPRLFALCLQQSGCIAEKGQWVEGVWRWNWSWRRDLRGRDVTDFDVLSFTVNNICLRQGNTDSWSWKATRGGIYSTSSAYLEIKKAAEVGGLSLPIQAFKWIWSKIAPHKASVVAWRFLRDRLPTKMKLFRRNIITSQSATLCDICKEEPETANHLLIHCRGTAGIWGKVLLWLNVVAANHEGACDHFLQFLGLIQGKRGKHFCIGLWVCVVWVIWKSRNSLIFETKDFVADKIVDEIKAHMWSWSSICYPEICLYSYNEWLLDVRKVLSC